MILLIDEEYEDENINPDDPEAEIIHIDAFSDEDQHFIEDNYIYEEDDKENLII
jgi:hypothetical protein